MYNHIWSYSITLIQLPLNITIQTIHLQKPLNSQPCHTVCVSSPVTIGTAKKGVRRDLLGSEGAVLSRPKNGWLEYDFISFPLGMIYFFRDYGYVSFRDGIDISWIQTLWSLVLRRCLFQLYAESTPVVSHIDFRIYLHLAWEALAVLLGDDVLMKAKWQVNDFSLVSPSTQ